MTDKLLCPVCDKPIEIDDVHLFYVCKNNRCVLHNVGGDLKLWQMFANTMNERNLSYDDNISLAGKLDIAVGALESIVDYGKIACSELQKNALGQFQKPVSKMQDIAHLAIKQINDKDE